VQKPPHRRSAPGTFAAKRAARRQVKKTISVVHGRQRWAGEYQQGESI